MFLPHTGIDYPFLKKKITFIKDAPDFEAVQPVSANARFIMQLNGSIQHSLASRPLEHLPRPVYDCTYVGGSIQTVGNGSQPKDKD